MKNNRNHHYLENSKYLGDAILNDYVLYEIYNYPGALPLKGSKVYGEVYEIDEDTKRKVDILEDVGNLYNYKIVDVIMDNKTISVGFYEFIDNGINYPLSNIDKKWKNS